MILSHVLDIVVIALVLATLPLLAELLVLTVASLLPSTREIEQAGTTENVWVDPQGYQAAVAEREAAFEAELMRQEQGSAGNISKP